MKCMCFKDVLTTAPNACYWMYLLEQQNSTYYNFIGSMAISRWNATVLSRAVILEVSRSETMWRPCSPWHFDRWLMTSLLLVSVTACFPVSWWLFKLWYDLFFPFHSTCKCWFISQFCLEHLTQYPTADSVLLLSCSCLSQDHFSSWILHSCFKRLYSSSLKQHSCICHALSICSCSWVCHPKKE